MILNMPERKINPMPGFVRQNYFSEVSKRVVNSSVLLRNVAQ